MMRLYPSHVPLSASSRVVLTLGTSIGAFLYPQRADLVAAVGELTGRDALRSIYLRMLESPEGQKVMSEKPVITDEFLKRCEQAPPGSFGDHYFRFMSARDFRADERPPVRFIEDPEIAYVATRYRQIHDFWHTIFACDTSLLGETALKGLEFTQTGLPMAGASVAAGLVRLKPRKREILTNKALPWAVRAGLRSVDLMSIYYENHVNVGMQHLRQKWRVITAPSPISIG